VLNPAPILNGGGGSGAAVQQHSLNDGFEEWFR
jgi:hypothetical protein